MVDATLAAQYGAAEANEGPGVEEVEVVVIGEGERRASGRERCDGRVN